MGEMVYLAMAVSPRSLGSVVLEVEKGEDEELYVG